MGDVISSPREGADLAAGESDAEFAVRADNTYAELERRLAEESGVTAVTFAEQLPGMFGEVSRSHPSRREVLARRLVTSPPGPRS